MDDCLEEIVSDDSSEGTLLQLSSEAYCSLCGPPPPSADHGVSLMGKLGAESGMGIVLLVK